MKPDRYETSRALWQRACGSLAGGVSSEFRKAGAPHPLFYDRAAGARIVDVDGNEYLDFTLSQGPLILGHSHPEVIEAVERASRRGQIFAGQHLEELELAERLQRFIPCAELMRFSLSGSEADHTALRLARAYTGRPRFIRFEGHYHGWFDNAAVGIAAPSLEALGPREAPVPARWTAGLPPRIEDEMLVLPWNDLDLVREALERHGREIAAVITEPVMCNNGCIPPEPGFLGGLRALCNKHGVVLIFDEVITGFRLGPGGAQRLFDVTPDLGIFGKALASGYPLSVLAGRKELMGLVADGKVIHAGTMNAGNPSVAAALATLTVLERDRVPDRLFALGRKLMAGLETAAAAAGHQVLVQGPGPMFHLGFTGAGRVRDYRDTFAYDRRKYAAFVSGMQERGVRLIPRGLWYVSGAHAEADVARCLETAADVLRSL